MNTTIMEPTNGYPQKVFHRPVKRWVQTMDLRDNPQLIAEYRRRHSRGEVWPEVLQGIRDCGLLEMEIYILVMQLVVCQEMLLQDITDKKEIT